MKGKLRLGFSLGICCVFVLIVAIAILYSLGFELPSNKVIDLFDGGWLDVLVGFFAVVLLAPLLEELVFRLIPLGITLKFTKSKAIFWAVAFVSSVVFGVSHGSWYNIFVQGIIGMIFSWAFLKGGYWLCFFAHASCNLLLITPLLLAKILKIV